MERKNPVDPFVKHKLHEAVSRLEVSSNHSLKDFKYIRKSFEGMLQKFKQFEVSYAIESASYQGEARSTVAKGELLNGLCFPANCIPYNQGRLHTKELWQPPYFHISRSY